LFQLNNSNRNFAAFSRALCFLDGFCACFACIRGAAVRGPSPKCRTSKISKKRRT
jgi:hypothetical protein